LSEGQEREKGKKGVKRGRDKKRGIATDTQKK
jgi:hypothetical protein